MNSNTPNQKSVSEVASGNDYLKVAQNIKAVSQTSNSSSLPVKASVGNHSKLSNSLQTLSNKEQKEQNESFVDLAPTVNVKPVNYKNRSGMMAYKQFSLRHVFRGGAIIWIKSRGKDYYVVFKSLTRPGRGIQLPGGRVEKRENLADTIIREVFEETGIQCRIICPLGYVYFENPKDDYSNMQTYYIVKPLYPIDVTKRWRYVDKDSSRQTLEVWCVDAELNPEFLAVGQDSVVHMFRQWLIDHKKVMTELNPLPKID